MPNLANTLEKMTVQDVYSLIYSVYKSEADRQTHENDNLWQDVYGTDAHKQLRHGS